MSSAAPADGGEADGEPEQPGSPGPGAAPGPARVLAHRLDGLQPEEVARLWGEQTAYIDSVEARLKELEEKGAKEGSRREALLTCRLTVKEQELQEMAAQMAELKAAQAPSTAALRNTLLDPAVNLVIQRLTRECDSLKKQAEEAQNELAAWKFTPDSATGKRLMAKCRQLYQENEDLGKMIASGRLAKLEGELALQKNLTEEMKKNQLEMDEFMAELDEDVEGMQSTIYYLQQQLREAKDTIARLEGGPQGEEPGPRAEGMEGVEEGGPVEGDRTPEEAVTEEGRTAGSEEESEAPGRRTARTSSPGTPGRRGRGRGGPAVAGAESPGQPEETRGRRGKRKKVAAVKRSRKEEDSEEEKDEPAEDEEQEAA